MEGKKKKENQKKNPKCGIWDNQLEGEFSLKLMRASSSGLWV